MPRDALCHICGQRVLVSGFKFHQKQCAKKYQAMRESIGDPVSGDLQGALNAVQGGAEWPARVASLENDSMTASVTTILGKSGMAPGNTLDASSRSRRDGDLPLALTRCRYCERSFKLDRLLSHEDICGKIQQKALERGKFDIKQQRLLGPASEIERPDEPLNETWRQNSSKLRDDVRTQRGLSKGRRRSRSPAVEISTPPWKTKRTCRT